MIELLGTAENAKMHKELLGSLMMIRAVVVAGVCALAVAQAAGAASEVVSFKDAAKIRSWDAWNDNGRMPTKSVFRERRCVTRENLLKMDAGLPDVGRLATRPAQAITSSWWSVGCETLDRDYADWDQYKILLGDLGATRGRLF